MSSSDKPSDSTLPVNLGKPSLRRRLEAYYQRVAPEQVSAKDWKDRFDKIWQKFGGSHAGEHKLAAKLAQKYGALVQLQIVTPAPAKPAAVSGATTTTQSANVHTEEYFALTTPQRRSGIVSFTDARFDPRAALSASQNVVREANPWLGQASLLDRLDLCRSLLPESDPLYQPALAKRATKPAARPPKLKAPPALAAIASLYQEGPLSILYQALVRRKRVRVLVRYLHGIRGTLSGHLLAFDKHFNLLLSDATEVYSPSHIADDNKSPTEREVERRLRAYQHNDTAAWTCRQRYLGQVLVRGDNVVLVYKPEQEQSAWPVTSKSPAATLYRRQSARRDVPAVLRVGTPGSLGLRGNTKAGPKR